MAIDLDVNVLVERVQDLRPPDCEDGDATFIAAEHEGNLPRLTRLRLFHQALGDGKTLVDFLIFAHEVERLGRAHFVHELKRRPHHQTDLDRHLEIGDVGDAAIEHFPHQPEERTL